MDARKLLSALRVKISIMPKIPKRLHFTKVDHRKAKCNVGVKDAANKSHSEEILIGINGKL